MTNERAIELLHRISDSQFDGIHGDERREALDMAVRALESNLVQESDSLVKDLVKDCISRKMVIDAIEQMQLPIMRSEWESDQFKFSALAEVREMISGIPSAHPETHDKRTETHACDLISRQAAIAIVRNRCKRLTTACVLAVTEIEQLPSAQPEVLDCGSGELVKDSQRLVEASSNDMISRQQAIEAFEPEHHTDWYTPTIIKTLEELPHAQPHWIPCSERLPRTEDFMIITILDDGGDIPIIYSDFGWYASVGGFWVVDNETRKDVIAWMPLPEPYGGDTK